MSNEKRVPGCLGYIGGYTTQLCGDYFINHEIRIPFLNNQYFMESKAGFFERGSYVTCQRNSCLGIPKDLI